MKALQAAHRRQGFTIIELMVVVGIVGVISMLAAPRLTQYRIREDARSLADAYRGALSEARSQAITRGTPHFVLFNSPAIPEWVNGSIALVVNDIDSSRTITVGDAFVSPASPFGLRQTPITLFGVGASTEPYKDATPPPEDQNAPVDLEALAQGSSFATDPVTGVPAVMFNSQGIPISMQTPTAFGSGAGAIYVTDNTGLVFAVILEPLGAVRIRALRPGTNIWY